MEEEVLIARKGRLLKRGREKGAYPQQLNKEDGRTLLKPRMKQTM